ncbi:MAG: hypothetical protein BRC49_10675 [Cyanobacteria bacterium SW_10_48_33]|nr:MAG: hypothetical protein BRC46_06695 [Cyanobacteria bacterium QS_6_48_18]PSP10184.1 MAG: hypothetical protein BRC49_10675 [Cyanobacteria bacterium SW_10_48_33]
MRSDQNPVEKVGLPGTNQLRQLAKICPFFERMNSLFPLILDHEAFIFLLSMDLFISESGLL